jgi:hypothetical protein
VCTSIEERRIGDPLRRRSSYLRVEHSTAEREAKIVTLRTPGSSHEFHAGMAGLAKALRGWILENHPRSQEFSISGWHSKFWEVTNYAGDERHSPTVTG